MSDITEKWGRSVAERGFAQVPNYLLLLNQFLDKDTRLSPVELLVLVQLVGTWWKKADQPFPSMSTLAVRCGVSERQIQRAVNRLVELELIKRVKRRLRGIISSNAYDLGPLVSVLEDIAKVFPNEFPRRVDRGDVQAISRRFAGSGEAASSDQAPRALAWTPPGEPLENPPWSGVKEVDFETGDPVEVKRPPRGKRNIKVKKT